MTIIEFIIPSTGHPVLAHTAGNRMSGGLPDTHGLSDTAGYRISCIMADPAISGYRTNLTVIICEIMYFEIFFMFNFN